MQGQGSKNSLGPGVLDLQAHAYMGLCWPVTAAPEAARNAELCPSWSNLLAANGPARTVSFICPVRGTGLEAKVVTRLDAVLCVITVARPMVVPPHPARPCAFTRLVRGLQRRSGMPIATGRGLVLPRASDSPADREKPTLQVARALSSGEGPLGCLMASSHAIVLERPGSNRALSRCNARSGRRHQTTLWLRTRWRNVPSGPNIQVCVALLTYSCSHCLTVHSSIVADLSTAFFLSSSV